MKTYCTTVILLGIVFTLCIGFPTDKVRHYNGYKVIRISPGTLIHHQTIQKLVSADKYDFWRLPTFQNDPYDVMLSPSEQNEVLSLLDKVGVPYHIIISDVEEIILQERQRQQVKQQDMDWENYHTWSEVNTWLSALVSSNNLITSQKYGSSYEGRDMIVYKVSSGPGNKTGFWIDATIHAREHITTAVITYIINELVQNSRRYADILDKVDFYFAPFLNPDGYVYTHEVDRMWRKTRSNWGNHSEECIGVDANRNFGFHWGQPDGASSNPCSGSYHGPEPYSEPETRAMRDYILDKAENHNVTWSSYVSLHSYSQLWISPWGYTRDLPDDHEEVVRLANQAVMELKSHFNTSYTTGSSSNVLYTTSGTSQDWAKGEGGFKYVYTVELRDTGRYGFLLPPEQILDTAVETWAGIQVVAGN